MNLQTVDDLIEELQRLAPAARKRPIHFGNAGFTLERQGPIVVQDQGPYTTLTLGRQER